MHPQSSVSRALVPWIIIGILICNPVWKSAFPEEPNSDSVRLHVNQLKNATITGKLGGEVGVFHSITACWRFEMQKRDWWHLEVLTIDDVKCENNVTFGESCVRQSGLGLHPPRVGTESQLLSARVYETVGTTGYPANYLNEIGEKQSQKMHHLEVTSILHIVKGKTMEDPAVPDRSSGEPGK